MCSLSPSLHIEALMLFAFAIYFNNFYVVLQPVFSPSVLAEMMRPDGSSTISVLGGESLSSELAHELMGIQVIQRLRCGIISFLSRKMPKL